MIVIAIAKVDSINDQIITCLGNGDGTVATYNVGVRGCTIRVEIVAYKTRESDAVIIGIMPFADNRKNFLNSGSVGSVGSVDRMKLSANDRSILQFFQKSSGLVMWLPHVTPESIGLSLLITPLKIWKAM